jgi:hypothetical protein
MEALGKALAKCGVRTIRHARAFLRFRVDAFRRNRGHYSTRRDEGGIRGEPHSARTEDYWLPGPLKGVTWPLFDYPAS